MTPFAPLLEAFFLKRLMQQRQVSEHTIAAYRDSFRLFLRFAQKKLGKQPADLELSDIDAELIGAFLEHLESERGNGIRTRNARLAAIHSFFRFVALEVPECSGLIYRVLAIPQKRCVKRLVSYLNHLEAEALLASPDLRYTAGRRDHAMLLLMLETGLRVSEMIALNCEDVVFGQGAHVRCLGKGRKERCTPLSNTASTVIEHWIEESQAVALIGPLFISRLGGRLSRDAVEHLVAKHAKTAASNCHSLIGRRVTPHVLRHSTAVSLLQAGVDRSVIALWLGHEHLETTQIYLSADLKTKERALARVMPHVERLSIYTPKDEVLAFLESL